MPPFGFRKRSPSNQSPPSSRKRRKRTLFEAADESPKSGKALKQNRELLDALNGNDESSLSEAETDEFEDVPTLKRRKLQPSEGKNEHGMGDENHDDDGGDDEEMDWEDAIPTRSSPNTEIADVSISMKEDGSYIEPIVSAAIGKKGPSKRERQIRNQTHCLHVQMLMWHNTLRNSWLNDVEVQTLLVDGLTEGVRAEVLRWKQAMGMLSKEELNAKKQRAASMKGKGKRGGKGNQKTTGRDWNYEAEHAEPGSVNMSGGDPLLRLLKVLTAYWRKRFTITAPGIRKQGYKSLRRLRDEMEEWKTGPHVPEEHGEYVKSRSEFRTLAKKCEGSRDAGAQLFVALLRGLGLETRMVANLQPVGFGWSKSEDAHPKKPRKVNGEAKEISNGKEDTIEAGQVQQQNPVAKPAKSERLSSRKNKNSRSSKGNKDEPIDLDDSDSSLSSLPSELTDDVKSDDEDISIIDVTSATTKKKVTRKFDRDLAFPSYWAEVFSPVSQKYYPVDPIVLSTIASNDELLQTFEPRGKKAEVSKQVICYTIGYSSDGSAKDVTVRYLKKHQLPGKTKGMRIPIEKIPVYNHKGKVKKYEDYDWFRTLMSAYDRPHKNRTAADDQEEQTDLKPFKPVKEEKEIEKESLQWYKQSAEYVLEQHLRREEALLPDSKPVKMFTAGKGDKAKDYDVYHRSDVVVCKTVETWHKEGRAIKPGEQPMKYVPMRAVTLIRKREMEDAQRETGEKLKQGLYSKTQTDLDIPPPIQNGVIPRNGYGNMDVFASHMVPAGAVHLPLKGSAKLCKKLGIDFAEACTDFEFGKQRAVPVLKGVVVAVENEHLVRDAWRVEQEEQRRKDDSKRTGVALQAWRKMVLGLRVLERMRTEYADSGGKEEEINPFVARAKREAEVDEHAKTYVFDEGGEFFGAGHDEKDTSAHWYDENGDEKHWHDTEGGGFLVSGDGNETVEGGGFLIESEENEGNTPAKNLASVTPVSLQSMHKQQDNLDDSLNRDETTPPLISTTISHARNIAKNVGNSTSSRKFSTKSRRHKSDLSEEADDDEESPLSSPINVEETSEGSDSAFVSEPEEALISRPSARAKPRSPKVVIPTQRRRAVKAKSQPDVRSKYFNNSDNSETNGEPEVIKPRRTTARTRTRN